MRRLERKRPPRQARGPLIVRRPAAVAGVRGRAGGGSAAAAMRAVLWPSAGGRSGWRATGSVVRLLA